MSEPSLLSKNSLPIPEWASNDIVINEINPSDKEGRIIARSKIECFQSALQGVMGSNTGDMEQTRCQ